VPEIEAGLDATTVSPTDSADGESTFGDRDEGAIPTADSSTGAADGADSATASNHDASTPSDASVGCTSNPCTMWTGLNGPFAVVVDATRVYWIEYGTDVDTRDGAVKSCPVAGCSGGPLVYATQQNDPSGIVVDGQNVYWGTRATSPDAGASPLGGIWSCPLAGCPSSGPTKLAPASHPYGLAVGGTNVYWVDDVVNTVNRVDETLQTTAVLYDGGNDVIPIPERIHVDGTSAYVVDQNGDIARMPLGGSATPVVILPGQGDGDYPFAIDSASLFSSDWSGDVIRVDKSTTDGGTVTLGVGLNPAGIAIDEDAGNVYWADWGSGDVNDGVITRVALDGTRSVSLASSLDPPMDIAINASYVFWVSQGHIAGSDFVRSSGSLFRLAR
jgi:hypothetical protein